jgi:hypothetical protein
MLIRRTNVELAGNVFGLGEGRLLTENVTTKN